MSFYSTGITHTIKDSTGTQWLESDQGQQLHGVCMFVYLRGFDETVQVIM